jgi:hypothetical protein
MLTSDLQVRHDRAALDAGLTHLAYVADFSRPSRSGACEHFGVHGDLPNRGHGEIVSMRHRSCVNLVLCGLTRLPSLGGS